MTQAQLLYPQARVYYERIEPVAEIWGSLDTAIDGRWENPVTVASQFTGFHKIEQLLWEDNTLAGAPQLCAGLLQNEQQLLRWCAGAVQPARDGQRGHRPHQQAATDFPVFQANVDGAMQVVALLTPYLQRKDHALVDLIQRRRAAVAGLLARYRASPGYDGTGYVEYSTVLDGQRRQLAAAVNALAEAMSQISVRVG